MVAWTVLAVVTEGPTAFWSLYKIIIIYGLPLGVQIWYDSPDERHGGLLPPAEPGPGGWLIVGGSGG